MIHSGTFPIGIEHEGKFCRDYVLEEERFRHKLEVYTAPGADREKLADQAYLTAAILARRLVVPGIDQMGLDEKTNKPVVTRPGRGVTPEMVLDLFPEDGNELSVASSLIIVRRAEFRKSAGDRRPKGDGSGADQDRLPPP